MIKNQNIIATLIIFLSQRKLYTKEKTSKIATTENFSKISD